MEKRRTARSPSSRPCPEPLPGSFSNEPSAGGPSRRDVGRLVAAAAGGVLAGAALAACGSGEDHDYGDDGEGGEAGGVAEPLREPHVCRGLNTCKGLGAGGDNACAGRGTCATAAHHGCHGQNECRGQGGCGTSAGRNACAGKGECGVPLGHDSWSPTREAFESAMRGAGREFGEAPDEGA